MRNSAEFYVPEQFAVTERQREAAHQFVTAVGSDLRGSLPSLGQQDLCDIETQAAQFLLDFKVIPAYLDAKSPKVWEQGALLLGMAHMWIESFEPHGQSREDIRKWLSFLIPQEVRQKQLWEPDEQHPFAGSDRVYTELMRRAWPESHGSYEWVAHHVADDHLAVLPYSSSYGSGQPSLMSEVWEISRDLGTRAVPFTGVAFPDHGFALVTADASAYVKQHEWEHAANANLTIGYLGEGLNEGETVRRTLEKVTPRPGEADCYGSELSLVRHLRKDQELGDLLEDRYECLEDRTVKPLASRMIELHGPQGHVLAYVANSLSISRGEYEEISDGASRGQMRPYVEFREATGLLPTSNVVYHMWYDTGRQWR